MVAICISLSLGLNLLVTGDWEAAGAGWKILTSILVRFPGLWTTSSLLHSFLWWAKPHPSSRKSRGAIFGFGALAC